MPESSMIGSHIHVDGRALLSLTDENGTSPLEASGGGTLCLVDRIQEGLTNTRDGIVGNYFVTSDVEVPDAARHCFGLSGGVMVQKYPVHVKDAADSTIYVPATAPILYAGIRAISRVRANIEAEGEQHDQSSVKVTYLEAMYTPD